MNFIVGPAEESPTEGGEWEVVEGMDAADEAAKRLARKTGKGQVVFKLVEMSYHGPLGLVAPR